MKPRFESLLHRAATLGLLITATASLAGCAAVEKNFGGQVLGAQVTLMGVTVAVSGTIPAGEKEPATVAAPAP